MLKGLTGGHRIQHTEEKKNPTDLKMDGLNNFKLFKIYICYIFEGMECPMLII